MIDDTFDARIAHPLVGGERRTVRIGKTSIRTVDETSADFAPRGGAAPDARAPRTDLRGPLDLGARPLGPTSPSPVDPPPRSGLRSRWLASVRGSRSVPTQRSRHPPR